MSERDIAEACKELASVLQDTIAEPTPVVYAIRNLIEEIINQRTKS